MDEVPFRVAKWASCLWTNRGGLALQKRHIFLFSSTSVTPRMTPICMWSTWWAGLGRLRFSFSFFVSCFLFIFLSFPCLSCFLFGLFLFLIYFLCNFLFLVLIILLKSYESIFIFSKWVLFWTPWRIILKSWNFFCLLRIFFNSWFFCEHFSPLIFF